MADQITRERIDALAAEWADVITTRVAPRATAKAKALGATWPGSRDSVEWSIEGDEFVGRWTDYYCGQSEEESMWLTFEAAAMDDDDFSDYVTWAVAEQATRKSATAARAQAEREAGERAEFERLARKYAEPSGG